MIFWDGLKFWSVVLAVVAGSVALAVLSGTSAGKDLQDALVEKESCERFQAEYNRGQFTEPPTVRISDRIETCKKLGAWK